jgi:membrane-associated protease RseP (regulator of RpoE activity)
MLRMSLLVLAGLGAGLAVAMWLGPVMPSGQPSATATATRTTVDSGEAAARLESLEAALQAEAEYRAALEARVTALASELESLRAMRGGAEPDAAEGADAALNEPGERPRFARNAALRGDLQRRQLERLIAAGFPPDRAEWINRRTQELRMQALQAQYDARREGRPPDPTALLAGDNTLRAELGDTDYERYLEALDRPTSVAVQDVLASSPAERYGLKAGDEVVAYDGQRVFDMRELNALTLKGNAGESVVVDVRREGQTLQLVMPRGPIGIFGGGFRGR